MGHIWSTKNQPPPQKNFPKCMLSLLIGHLKFMVLKMYITIFTTKIEGKGEYG
jgi:hypothetical protein